MPPISLPALKIPATGKPSSSYTSTPFTASQPSVNNASSQATSQSLREIFPSISHIEHRPKSPVLSEAAIDLMTLRGPVDVRPMWAYFRYLGSKSGLRVSNTEKWATFSRALKSGKSFEEFFRIEQEEQEKQGKVKREERGEERGEEKGEERGEENGKEQEKEETERENGGERGREIGEEQGKEGTQSA